MIGMAIAQMNEEARRLAHGVQTLGLQLNPDKTKGRIIIACQWCTRKYSCSWCSCPLPIPQAAHEILEIAEFQPDGVDALWMEKRQL
ncbi:unnamed protein product [Trichogramma brassicae]|uniref:Uncharacterized protein n=1 Tax=Trichogramma brassicae TaxID=86971 RepID=A0A6H5I6L4_9HYME|nr:unnamed protein product [Trichogramma brassicae]